MKDRLFGSDLWQPVLEKYSAVTGLTVELFQADGQLVQTSKPATPIYALFKEYGFKTGLFAECARRCLEQTNARPALIATEVSGLTVIGTSLSLDGTIVGAAVAGYAMSTFSQVQSIQRWAQTMKVPFDRLWDVTRKLPPIHEGRLQLHGELLQVLGDALLRENLRTRQYEETALRLKAADAAKDDFLALLSHELRTPLVPILGWAHLLKRHEGSEQVRKAAEVIERNARSQSRMIEDLLDINLIAHGSVRLNLHIHDLRVMVNAAVESCAAEVERKGLRLEVVEEGGRLPVTADIGRMEQVFRNIVNNAVKFTLATGRIRVAMARDGQHAVVKVTDAGKGIEASFLPFVFDKFRQQERGPRREHEGLGIGLALVKQLTELHNGTVTATSEGPGRGTEVVVRIPLTTDVPPLEALSFAARDAPAFAGISILVVEDSADSLDYLCNLLTQLGAAVTSAATGSLGLESVVAATPDVVLCDLGMSGMDGFEFLSRVRQLGLPKRMPVIAISGYTSEADRLRSREAGFSAHLAKPFSEAVLITTVSSVIGPRATDAATARTHQASSAS